MNSLQEKGNSSLEAEFWRPEFEKPKKERLVEQGKEEIGMRDKSLMNKGLSLGQKT